MSKLMIRCFGKEFGSYSRKKKILWLFGIILMIAGFISMELYLRRTMESQTDSDISSELILANLLAEEGSVVSSNWYYSTEIRVLNTNLVFAPLFRVFHSWHKVRLLGTVIIHFCLLISIYIFCRVTKLISLFPIIGLMLVLPFSGVYYSYVLQFPYYVPHIVITILTFSLICYGSENNHNIGISVAVLFLGLILAFLAGMGGARQLIVFFIPLFLAVLLPYMHKAAKVTDNIVSMSWKRYLSAAFLCLVSSLIGYLINVTVMKDKYHFMVYEVSFSSFDISRISGIISGFFTSLGFMPGKLEGRVLLHNIFVAFLSLGSIFSAFQGIKVGRKKSDSYFFFSLYYISSIVIFILLFTFTDMNHFDRHNLPIVFLTAPMIAMGLKHLDNYKYLFRSAVLVIWTVLILFSGYDNLKSYGIHRGKTDHQEIAAYLLEHGYYKGYAAFWSGNVLTELSDGAIDVYTWGDHLGEEAGGDVDRTYKWLQLVKHDTQRPEGKVFLLFQNNAIRFNMDTSEAARKRLWKLRDERIILKQGYYTIYGYENYGDMISDIYDYDFIFQEGNWLINGEDIEGSRILYENGISHGPYMQFRPGRYRVTIQGENLSLAELACTYGSENACLDIEMITNSDQKIVCDFVAPEKVENGEIVIKNTSADNIEIYSEQIDFLEPTLLL